ncbi:hypothetical protein LCGC14_2684280 [marine sediment metagenome]|uniref:Uncharacterized protein n=1 Tax=marine sediment metagenome TaxID=412755 RepID=A0A0F8ZKE1_9ZZZZ
MVLFGNKIDLVDEASLDGGNSRDNANVEQFAKDNKFIGYYKTSALTGDGVIDAFKVLVKKLYMIAKISSF